MKSYELISRVHIGQILDANIMSADISGRICDSFVMIYLMGGKVNITMANEVFEMAEDTIAIIRPNEFYCVKGIENSEFAYIEFTYEGPSLDNAIVSVTDEEKKLIKEVCDMISGSPDSTLLQRLYTMLELILINCMTKERLFPLKTEKDAALFSKASEILSQNVTLQLSVSALADSLNISLSHLKRIFAKYTLVGVHEYFTYLKISHAKELLKLGETVTHTAELSGFSNQAYFSAAFKRITGISPKEFAGDIKTHRIQKQAANPQQQQPKDLPSYLL